MSGETHLTETILRAIVEQAPVALILTGPADRDTPILYANREFTRLTGYLLADIRGKNPRCLQPPELTPQQREERGIFATRVRAGEPALGRLVNQRKDGTNYWTEFRIRPIKGSKNQIKAWIGAQIDVSDRVAAEARIEHLLETFVDRELDLLSHLLWKTARHAAYIGDRLSRLAAAAGPSWIEIDHQHLLRAAKLAMVGFLLVDDSCLAAADLGEQLGSEQSEAMLTYAAKSAELAITMPLDECIVEAVEEHQIAIRSEDAADHLAEHVTTRLGQALTILAVLDTHIRARLSLADAFDAMQRQCRSLETDLLASARELLPVLAENGWPERWEAAVVSIPELRPDYIVNEDLHDSQGRLLMKKGQVFTESNIQRLRDLDRKSRVSKSIAVTLKR